MLTDQELADKLAFLDARDKLLRQQLTKQTELSNARTYIGTCNDMCPERERYSRLGFQLSIFERDEQNQPDQFAMVKEYRRAGADQEEPLPHDLRTPLALRNTMDYLIQNIMDDSRSKLPDLALLWYDYLWDRLRAVRKDITQQNICDQSSAKLVEQCTRFHVHSCYAMNRVASFDVDMNKRNLNDCLQMLRQMYNDMRITGVVCPGELEFQKYDILLHLDEDPLSTNVIMKTSDHRSSKDMKFVTQVFSAYTNNDYYKFFKLMERADYMESCILSLYINKMRLNGLKIIISACTLKQVVNYPADIAIETLGFDDLDDLKTFASLLDIEIQEKDSKHYILLNKNIISSIRKPNSSIVAMKSRRLVENKMRGHSVGQLVYGELELPANPYRQSIVVEPIDHEMSNEAEYITQDMQPEIPDPEPTKLIHEQVEWPEIVVEPEGNIHRAVAIQETQENRQERYGSTDLDEESEEEEDEDDNDDDDDEEDLELEHPPTEKEFEPEKLDSPEPICAIPQDDEIVQFEEMRRHTIAVLSSRAKARNFDIPAGRFKTTQNKSILKVQPYVKKPISPPPIKKSRIYDSEIRTIQDTLEEEKKANKSMQKIFNFWQSFT